MLYQLQHQKKKPFIIKFNVYFQFPSKTKSYKDVWEVSSSDLAEGGHTVLDCLDDFCRNQNPSMKLKSFRLGWRVGIKDVPTVCNGDFYDDTDVPTWDSDFTLVLTAIENPIATKKDTSYVSEGEQSEASSTNEYEKPPPKKVRRVTKNADSKKNKKTRTEKKQEQMENIEKELRRELPAFVQSKMTEDEFTKYSFLRHNNQFVWTIGKITEDVMNEKNNNNNSCNNETAIPYMVPPISQYMPPPVQNSHFQQPHMPPPVPNPQYIPQPVPNPHFQQPQVGTAPIMPDMQSTMSNMVQLQMMKMMEKLAEH